MEALIAKRKTQGKVQIRKTNMIKTQLSMLAEGRRMRDFLKKKKKKKEDENSLKIETSLLAERKWIRHAKIKLIDEKRNMRYEKRIMILRNYEKRIMRLQKPKISNEGRKQGSFILLSMVQKLLVNYKVAKDFKKGYIITIRYRKSLTIMIGLKKRGCKKRKNFEVVKLMKNNSRNGKRRSKKGKKSLIIEWNRIKEGVVYSFEYGTETASQLKRREGRQERRYYNYSSIES